jgi:regulator of protease activity HflC (stomatin/prohibitin superfamily)
MTGDITSVADLFDKVKRCFPRLRCIDETECAVLLRCGKFVKTLDPGIHLLLPLIHEVFTCTRVEQGITVGPMSCMSINHVPIVVELSILYSVSDAEKVLMKFDDVDVSLTAYVAAKTVEYASSHTCDETFDAKRLERGVFDAVKYFAEDEWGLTIHAVHVITAIKHTVLRLISDGNESVVPLDG